MDFSEFLNYAVTPYHTVDFLKKALSVEGITLMERGGALIAVRLPKKACSKSRFRIALAHTDFPALKIAPNPDKGCAGVKTLHSEIYGSPLFTSWLDRDLGYAGLLAFEKNGQVATKLVRGKKLFRIPQLAIHLNRGVNQEGLKVNPQTDLDALWCAASGCKTAESASKKFVDTLQAELSAGERLLDFDVQLFDAQPANLGGLNDEWIYSGRLDNLSSCHAIADAMLSAKPLENDFVVAAFMNNEEVGSNTREGAAGNFLESTLEGLWNAAGIESSFTQTLADSLALSIDMAHAEHPNFPQKHEANHAPLLGAGVVLKTNSQKRYASDVLSSAQFRLLCEKAGVKCQTFITRNDMPCGSTVGPTISANLGIPTVDIGEPMLSMHSIREMIAVDDHKDLIQLVSTFYKDC